VSDPFDHWAIVEIFGHVRLAGRVTEATIGGCAFVRVDVPAVDGEAAYTRLYGQGAIYSITLVTEDTARRAAAQVREQPLTIYLPPLRLGAAGRYGYGDYDQVGDEGDDQ
jgi:hypothetical protein